MFKIQLQLIILQFAAQVAGYDRCWIFGDEFGSRSFNQYFFTRKSTDFNSYMKANFDVSGYFNNFMADNPSLLARFSNLMATGINESKQASKILPLPKLIIMVPDDDLINLLSKADTSFEFQKNMSHLINFIMTNFERYIATFKETLPAKCIKMDYPHMLWIQAPAHDSFHNNDLRYKFNMCLEDLVKSHTNTTTLALKKIWDSSDMNLFHAETHRFTVAGYKAYWEAVDKTVRYLDSVLLKKREKAKSQKINKNKFDQKDHRDNQDCFCWQNLHFNYRSGPEMTFKQLPTPPHIRHRATYH